MILYSIWILYCKYQQACSAHLNVVQGEADVNFANPRGKAPLHVERLARCLSISPREILEACLKGEYKT